MLVLMFWKDGTSNDIRNPPVKIVVTTADVQAMVARLRGAGHPITTEPTEFPGFGLIAFATDPDGYAIEMIQQS
jgi:predicted enzyme related to lactoylglutathione lyase